MPDLKNVAIVGVYLTDQGTFPQRSGASLYVEAVKGALADAGLSVKDVDGVIGSGPNGEGMGASAFADYFGVPIKFHDSVSIGAASQAGGACHAAFAIANGLATTVIVPTGAGGQGGGGEGPDRNSPFESLWGSTRTGDYAMVARRHMHEFGTTSEQLAEIAVAFRRHATMTPTSVMGPRGLITIDDVVNSRMIADPLHLMDCCLVNHGGGAVVLTTAERARDLSKQPVYLKGYGEGFTFRDRMSAPSMISFGGVYSAPKALAMAGVSHDDIDVVGMSDHFTIDVLVELEDIGFCKKGEGGPFVQGGTLQVGGKLPTNTDGGFLSHSHGGSCGIYTLVELVRQLRGECGERQVKDAKIAMAHGTGGFFNAQYTAILGRD